MADRVQDFPAMLRTMLGDRVAQEASSFVDMLADDAVMEFPFAPPGLPTRLDGKGGVAEHLAKLARLISFERIGPATLLTSDAQTVVIAFEASGRGVETGAAYDQRYLSVITTRDGRIVRYLDYWNPLAVVRALSGDAAAATDLRGVYNA